MSSVTSDDEARGKGTARMTLSNVDTCNKDSDCKENTHICCPMYDNVPMLCTKPDGESGGGVERS